MSHIFQFVRFCKLFEPDRDICFEWFICKRRIEKYLHFLEDIGKAANTVANHAKSHDHFLKFAMCEIEVLENETYLRVIPQLQRWLKEERQRERAKVEVSRNDYDDEEELLKKGKWLTENELRKLYAYILQQISDLLDEYKETPINDNNNDSDNSDDISDTSDTDSVYELEWNVEDAEWFQANLITLLHFVIGGQRRQVIIQMTTKDFKIDAQGKMWCKVGVEKKQRLQAKDGIFIPPYVSVILEYYMKEVRPCLNPKKHVISLWINRNGNPLGKS